MNDKPTPDGKLIVKYMDGTEVTYSFEKINHWSDKDHGLSIEYETYRIVIPWHRIFFFKVIKNSLAHIVALRAWEQEMDMIDY